MVLMHSLYSQIVMNRNPLLIWLCSVTCHKWGWNERRNSMDVSFLTIAGDILWVILEIRRVGLHCLCSNCSSISCGSIPEVAPHFLLLKIVRSIFDGAEQIGKGHRVTKEGGRWNKSVCLLNTSRRIFREFLIFFSGGGVACLRHGVTDTL